MSDSCRGVYNRKARGYVKHRGCRRGYVVRNARERDISWKISPLISLESPYLPPRPPLNNFVRC